MTVPKRTLATRIAMLAPDKLDEVERALHFALGLRCGPTRYALG
jgi:mRNA-degrading endonuclease toxin of MazEF toxin-antitoxin module